MHLSDAQSNSLADYYHFQRWSVSFLFTESLLERLECGRGRAMADLIRIQRESRAFKRVQEHPSFETRMWWNNEWTGNKYYADGMNGSNGRKRFREDIVKNVTGRRTTDRSAISFLCNYRPMCTFPMPLPATHSFVHKCWKIRIGRMIFLNSVNTLSKSNSIFFWTKWNAQCLPATIDSFRRKSFLSFSHLNAEIRWANTRTRNQQMYRNGYARREWKFLRAPLINDKFIIILIGWTWAWPRNHKSKLWIKMFWKHLAMGYA